MTHKEQKDKEYQTYLENQRRQQLEQNTANIDYIAMMTGVDIPIVTEGEKEDAQ